MRISSGQYELNGLRRLEPQMIGAFCDRYYADVYRYVHYQFEDEPLVDELVAIVFARVLDGLKAGQGPQTGMTAWLLQTADDTITQRSLLSASQPSPAQTPTPWHQLRAALPAEQRRLLALRFGEGCSLDEACGLMKKNVGAVKQLQFRALAMLNRGTFTIPANEKLCDALEVCLQAIAQGMDVEPCLARFRSYEAILRPLLAQARQAREAAVREIPAEVLQRGRLRVLRYAAGLRQQKSSFLMFLPAWFKLQSWGQFSNLALGSMATVAFVAVGGASLFYNTQIAQSASSPKVPQFVVGDRNENGKALAPTQRSPRPAPSRVTHVPVSPVKPPVHHAPPPKKPVTRQPPNPANPPKPSDHWGDGHGRHDHDDHRPGHAGHLLRRKIAHPKK